MEITQEQMNQIEDALTSAASKENGANKDNVEHFETEIYHRTCEHFKVDMFEDFKQSQVDEVIAYIEGK